MTLRESEKWLSRLVVLMNELTVSHVAVLRGGCDMEDASSPERVAAVGRGDD